MDAMMNDRKEESLETRGAREESPGALVLRALRTGTDDAFEAITRRAADVIAWLDDNPEELEGAEEVEAGGVDDALFARLYEAIGAASPMSDEEIERSDEMLRSIEASAWSVGVDWRDHLLAGLPPELRNISGWFDGCPKITDGDARRWLLSHPSVRGAGGEKNCDVAALVEHGLTPISFVDASNIIMAIANPVVVPGEGSADGRAYFDSDKEVYLWADGNAFQSEPIAPNLFIDQVAAACGCDTVTAGRLLAWLAAAALSKPYLFERFVAVQMEPSSPRLGLAYIRGSKNWPDRLKRWSATALGDAVNQDAQHVASERILNALYALDN